MCDLQNNKTISRTKCKSDYFAKRDPYKFSKNSKFSLILVRFNNNSGSLMYNLSFFFFFSARQPCKFDLISTYM